MRCIETVIIGDMPTRIARNGANESFAKGSQSLAQFDRDVYRYGGESSSRVEVERKEK